MIIGVFDLVWGLGKFFLMLALFVGNIRSLIGKGYEREGGRVFLIVGIVYLKVLWYSIFENSKGFSMFGLKIEWEDGVRWGFAVRGGVLDYIGF